MTDTAEESSTSWITNSLTEHPPPDPLPLGWILRKSRSHPGAAYYYHQDSGETRWDAPIVYEGLSNNNNSNNNKNSNKEEVTPVVESFSTPRDPVETTTTTTTTTTATTTITEDVSMMKRDADEESGLKTSGATSKRQKTASSSSSSSPKEVRVLHILKKHKDSRRPSSWRIPNITATKEEATAELSELLEVIQESPTGDEMRATFEELARTESDCTSAKRGGDLGFFGRRKMQPPFEDASFALQIGELSGIVESSSGVHLILRIG